MSAATIHTFDRRQAVIVDPSEIKPGDWMTENGVLRQIDYVDTISVRTGPGVVHIVHFKHQDGVPNLVRGISEGADVAVFRTLPETVGAAPCTT